MAFTGPQRRNALVRARPAATMRVPVATLLLVALLMAGCGGKGGKADGEPAAEPSASPGGDGPKEVPLQPSTGVGPSDVDVGSLGNSSLAAIARLVDLGRSGAEPTIGATSDGTLFITLAGTRGDDSDVISRSSDGGLSWEVVYDYRAAYEAAGMQRSELRSKDPMLAVDPVTDRVFSLNQVLDVCSNIAWSDDNGAAWTDRPLSCVSPPVDHIKLVAAPPGPNAVPGSGVAYATVLTQCASQRGVASSCWRSLDGGLTWTGQTPLFNAYTTGCGGLVGRPLAARDGTLALPATWNCQDLTVAFSRDNGLTWDIHATPVDAGHSINPGGGFTPDGTFYAAARTESSLVEATASSDQGASWVGPWNVTFPGVRSVAFVTAAAGDDGHVAVAYIGSPDTNAHPSEAPDNTTWHLYMAWSLDANAAEPTWFVGQATPKDDPVQVGGICLLNFACVEGNRNLLDFIDSVVTPDGRFVVAFADGCTAGCAGNPSATPADSRDARSVVAILEGIDLRATS